MAVSVGSVGKTDSLPLEWAGEICTVARQPILNQRGRLQAYELLFKDNPGPGEREKGQTTIDAVVDDAVVFGLERFTNGFPAFIACTAEALAGQMVQILPPDLTILAIPETIEADGKLLDACHMFKSRGFRFALDDYTCKPHPLLELADYVRVDFSHPDAIGRDPYSRWLGVEPEKLVAKRVQTEDEYCRAFGEGFTLFQGDYLFRPALVKNRKVPANRLFHFEVLRELYRETIDLRRLSSLVMRDASLSYRLLRLVNSPICALRQEVRSIESAIIIVGVDTFRRFATLAILGEGNTTEQPEILHMALGRARFCELAARAAKLEPSEQYLLGMFSLLPIMLRVPMSEIAPALPLRDEMRRALEGADNHERTLLTWFERHEHGDWGDCDEIVSANRLSHDRLIRCYADAAVWANSALRSTENRSTSA